MVVTCFEAAKKKHRTCLDILVHMMIRVGGGWDRFSSDSQQQQKPQKCVEKLLISNVRTKMTSKHRWKTESLRFDGGERAVAYRKMVDKHSLKYGTTHHKILM